MTYTFVNISEVKFSINGRELYKTFIPVLLDASHIKVLNVYDGQNALVPKTPVANFTVNGSTYTNATDLTTAIYSVLFSKNASEAVSNAQIELNRLAIIDLENDKSNVGHIHDDRYYRKAEIDVFIANIVSQSDLLAKGEVDGDNINFRKADNTLVFTVNAESFTSQGTALSFNNGVLTLSNSKGEVLSTTPVKAVESYYDSAVFTSGIADDLSDLVLTNPFEIVKTTSDLYFFVSNITNLENFDGSRIYINDTETFSDLSTPTITTAAFYAWQITITSESFIDGNSYTYNFWDRRLTTPTGRIKEIEGSSFDYIPILGNDGSSFQAGDIIVNGWRSQNIFWKEAEYVSGDGAFFAAWNQTQ